EPLGIGYSATDVAETRFGDTVLVLGPGTIGQSAARTASWKGATRVIVVGMDDHARLATAMEVGATHCIDLAAMPDLGSEVGRITGGQPVDVVIDATGHPDSLNAGLGVLKRGGIYVVAGIHSNTS